MAEVATCKCLIGGEWTDARADGCVDIWNPSTGEVIGRTPLCGGEDVDRAVSGGGSGVSGLA